MDESDDEIMDLMEAIVDFRGVPDKYGICLECGFRVGVACKCFLSFREKIATVGLDEEALRRFKIDDARRPPSRPPATKAARRWSRR